MGLGALVLEGLLGRGALVALMYQLRVAGLVWKWSGNIKKSQPWIIDPLHPLVVR